MDKKPLISKWLAIGIILLFVGTFSYPTFAQDTQTSLLVSRGDWLYVGGSGPGNYTRIQDAIDNASDGDTVFVYSGIYPAEWITIDKALILIGENKNTTILDGQSSDNMILLVESSDVTIREFTLKNCKDNGMNQAIYIWGHPYVQHINISNLIMINNDKGIFFINTSDISISSCDIHYNDAQGIWGLYSSFINVDNCSLHNNGRYLEGTKFVSGGITINDMKEARSTYTDVTITNCNLYANQGRSIDVEKIRNVTIHNNNITSNLYGIHFDGIIHLNIDDNFLSMNKRWGIECFGFLPSSDVVIQRNNISHSGEDYGGLYLQGCPDIRVVNNSFYYNDIGVFSIGSQNTSISNNNFIANNKSIYISASSQCVVHDNLLYHNRDAGIYIQTGSPGVTIERNIIQGGMKGIYIGGASDGSHVFFNTITDNEIGISMYFSNKHNISSNTILNSSERALFLNYSCDNVLYHNNFINCSEDPYLYYNTGPKNRWMGNYWDRPRLLPKILIGTRLFSVNDLYLKLLVFEIDWHPAKEPYNIPGMS